MVYRTYQQLRAPNHWLRRVQHSDILPVYSLISPEASAGIFEQSLGTRNRIGIGLSYRPASYIGWRNWFFGIDSWLLKSFKIWVHFVWGCFPECHIKMSSVYFDFYSRFVLQRSEKASFCCIILQNSVLNPLSRIRILLFTSMRIRILTHTFFEIWTFQCPKMTL